MKFINKPALISAFLVLSNLVSYQAHSVMDWTPKGSLVSSVPKECLPENFEQQIMQARQGSNSALSPSEFARMTQSYFDHCGAQLSRGGAKGFSSLSDFSTASYNFTKNSQFQKLELINPDGTQINTLIGIKDEKSRPWIIYKCGIFCDVQEKESTVRNYLMHLYDQTPFNIIVIGNRTGHEYMQKNQVFQFGGLYEYQDFINIAQWLRYQSPYKNLVNSIHIVGLSLGGSSAFLLEQEAHFNKNLDKNLFQSITSVCAVSNLKQTVHNMYNDPLKRQVFPNMTWKKLQAAKPYLSLAQDLLSGDKPESKEFPNLISKIMSRYMNMDLNEEDRIEYLWKNTEYASLRKNSPRSSSIPLFILASQDDSIVDFKLNTGRLKNEIGSWGDNNSGIVSVPHGDHCALGTSYGYSTVAMILRSFILTHSPDFEFHNEEVELTPELFSAKLEANQIITRYWWAQGSRANSFQLKFETYLSDSGLCPLEKSYSGLENCQKTYSINIPMELISRIHFKLPNNKTETEAFVRTLNGHILPGINGESPIGTSNWPNQLVIRYN